MADGARPLRVFTAGLGTETNSFSPIDIDMAAFESCMLYRPSSHPRELSEVSAPLHVLRSRKAELGWEIVEGTYAFALPGGRVIRSVYEALRDEILDQLRDAGRVDFVALSLHGAMMAEGYDDCEGDLLQRVRALVGPDVPVGAEMDPHAHLTQAMGKAADILIAMKEYPHTDFLERGEELIALLERMARGTVRPVTAVFDCRMIGRFHTMREPMRSFVDRMMARERQPGILSISLIHGFPWGDTFAMGAKMLVIADDDPALAAETASSLASELWAMRDETFTRPVDLDAALRMALGMPKGPIVIADISDNPGGGAPGNSTVLLRKLMAIEGLKACIGPLWDPDAVEKALAAGPGARLRLKIGGGSGHGSGEPVEAEAEIIATASDGWQSWAGTRTSLGAACSVRVGGLSIILGSVRDQAYSPDLFTNLGVQPAEQRIIAVKSAQHFVAGFAPVAKGMILASGGGPLETDFRKIPYKKVRRPIWPLDELNVFLGGPE